MRLDGVPATAADLSALALYNYGHFTTMLVDRGRVRGLSRHLDRLATDCRTVFGADLDRDRVRHLVRRAVVDAATPTVVVRVTVFDPAITLAGSAGPVSDVPGPRLLVSTRATAPGPVALPPLRLRSCRYLRELPTVKHTGLFAALHHRFRARAAGFDDALFVTDDERVAEGPTWNIVLVVDGELVWPAAPCLPGVTARLLRTAAEAVGIRCRDSAVTLRDIGPDTAAFVSNATVGLRSVTGVDAVALAVAPATAALRRAYEAVTPEPL
ncbi:aminotransferase class IV [Solwaraspora sp. WMMB335]|uniref:aminotransferase class IV n=1 Tax=Solwaraspora sp. WMMB335 TaxID=3404118 RepID=UPI003B9582F6